MEYSIKYPLPPQTPVRISITDSDSDSRHKRRRSHHRHKHKHRKKHKHRRRKHYESESDVNMITDKESESINIKCEQPIINFIDLEQRMLVFNKRMDNILPPMEELNRLIKEYGNNNNKSPVNIPLLPNAMLENSPLHLPSFLHQFPSMCVFIFVHVYHQTCVFYFRNDINKFLDELDVAPYNANNDLSSIPNFTSDITPFTIQPSDNHPFSISSITNLPFSYAFNDPKVIQNKKQKKKKKKKKKKKGEIPKFKEKNQALVQQPLYSYSIPGIYHYNNHNNNYYINTFNTNTNINANTMMINNNNYPMANVPLLPLPVQAFSSQQQFTFICFSFLEIVLFLMFVCFFVED